jgi:hypothetical protein
LKRQNAGGVTAHQLTASAGLGRVTALTTVTRITTTDWNGADTRKIDIENDHLPADTARMTCTTIIHHEMSIAEIDRLSKTDVKDLTTVIIDDKLP